MNRTLILYIIFVSLFFSCKDKTNPKENIIGKAFTTAKTGLYLRESPSAKSNILNILKYNTEVEIIECSNYEETINGITGSWVKIKIKDPMYNEKFEGWVFSGFTSKDKPSNNEDLKDDSILSTIKTFEKYCRIDLGPGPLGFVYFNGDNGPNKENIIIDVSLGGYESYIQNIEYKKNEVILKIRHESFDHNGDGKIVKTEFYKCIISKNLLFEACSNKNEDTSYKCILEK